jgi:hypothetical protein
LRGTSYPGKTSEEKYNPNGVVAVPPAPRMKAEWN